MLVGFGEARPTLRRGSTGAAVKELQSLLNLSADGAFGAKTEAAVKAFQSARGLTSDGIVGAATWGALLGGAPTASSYITSATEAQWQPWPEAPPSMQPVTATTPPAPLLYAPEKPSEEPWWKKFLSSTPSPVQVNPQPGLSVIPLVGRSAPPPARTSERPKWLLPVGIGVGALALLGVGVALLRRPARAMAGYGRRRRR